MYKIVLNINELFKALTSCHLRKQIAKKENKYFWIIGDKELSINIFSRAFNVKKKIAMVGELYIAFGITFAIVKPVAAILDAESVK